MVIGSGTQIPYIANVMKSVRCLLAALLLLAFGGGTVLATTQNGDMIQPAIEASVDQPMPSGCNDCGGNDKAMTTAACSALGTCMQAVDPVIASTLPRPDSVVYPAVAERITGFEGSPEPFPPKAYIFA
ncbi:hypothetical protein [Chelativorans intermedius]|uniref:Uncharacterized protein n=1 Tax=Chelativorans intermedius TaxID=515947 RepID=A0ABV6DBY4_9HYPH|nr:hypothetical protein [Chelativorans intermedius]MCT9000333.1 hypothetical protein [Chelativorans intermedius]